MILFKKYDASNANNIQIVPMDGVNVSFAKITLSNGAIRFEVRNRLMDEFSSETFVFTDELKDTGSTIEDLLELIQTCILNYKNSVIIKYTYNSEKYANIISEVIEYNIDNSKEPETIEFTGTFTGKTTE